MKKKKHLIRQLFLSYLLIIVVSLSAVGYFAVHSFEQFYLKQCSDDLSSKAHLLSLQFADALSRPVNDSIDRLCKSLQDPFATRLTLILSGGKVVGDSHGAIDQMENHANRPEIGTALAGGVGKAVRYSRTLNRKMMYVAIPLFQDQRIIGAIRASLPITAIDRYIRTTQIQIALGGMLVALLAGMISLFFSRRMATPIEALKTLAGQFAGGDFSHRLPKTAFDEINELIDSLHDMARQLEQHIDQIVQQRNERDAIFSSMTEGVIAVDRHARIISINQTAAAFFNRTPRELKSHAVHAVLRIPDLNRMVDNALVSSDSLERDLMLFDCGERILNARSSALRDGQQRQIGMLLVLNDVTHLRRLERMREDFAANVSHEIKTPLTAIKGFVETLQSGMVENPNEARRFLAIIERHVNRLSAIITDLLKLAQIEKAGKNGALCLELRSLTNTVEAAIEFCREKALSKGISLDSDCREVFAAIDATLMEQVCVNLLDNAINYSPENSRVNVRIRTVNDQVVMHVIDQGIGIPARHLPRLFERFYRVDKSRSRKMGGTGLGLAIVKHIIQSHHGDIQVNSQVGKGATFTITLPAGKRAAATIRH